MEKLKVLLIAALFWTFIIWFARTIKRKSVEENRKFEDKMPEMEPVTEEERRYICEKLVDYTDAKNVFWWIMIFLNLLFVIIWAGKTINMVIYGDAISVFSEICILSIFIGITYFCNYIRTYLIKEKQQYEKGELKKKIVQVKRCGSSSQNGSYGEIEERNTGIPLILLSVVRKEKYIGMTEWHISESGRYAVFLDPYNGSRERQ